MRTCKRCGDNKPLDRFPEIKKSNGKLYHKHICKDCYSLERVQKRQNVEVKTREQSLAILDKNKAWRDSLEGMKNRMITTSKHRAKVNNLEHNITVEDIIIPDKCPVFNVEFVPGSRTDGFRWTPSLDRIDSSKGYVKGNIQVISWLANTMKNDANKEELILFSNWILSKYNDDIVQPAHIDESAELTDKEPLG